MYIVATLVVLFIIAIARGVPIWILILTLGSVTLMGIVVDRFFLLFDKKRG